MFPHDDSKPSPFHNASRVGPAVPSATSWPLDLPQHQGSPFAYSDLRGQRATLRQGVPASATATRAEALRELASTRRMHEGAASYPDTLVAASTGVMSHALDPYSRLSTRLSDQEVLMAHRAHGGNYGLGNPTSLSSLDATRMAVVGRQIPMYDDSVMQRNLMVRQKLLVGS